MTSPRAPFRWRLIFLLAGGSIVVSALLLGMVGWSVLRCLRLGPDAAALRDALAPSQATAWHKTCEFSAGWISLSVARLGLDFVPLPPEARQALAAVRGAEVAVYDSGKRQADPLSVQPFAAADRAMSARGWERLVGVKEPQQLLVIYVPKNPRSDQEIVFCLAVLDRSQLVVVAARTDGQALLEIADRFRTKRTPETARSFAASPVVRRP